MEEWRNIQMMLAFDLSQLCDTSPSVRYIAKCGNKMTIFIVDSSTFWARPRIKYHIFVLDVFVVSWLVWAMWKNWTQFNRLGQFIILNELHRIHLRKTFTQSKLTRIECDRAEQVIYALNNVHIIANPIEYKNR